MTGAETPGQMPSRARLSLWQAAFVVAGRDFRAILMSRAFLFFLLGPVFMIVIAGISGSLGSRASRQALSPEIGIAMSQADTDTFMKAYRLIDSGTSGTLPPMSAVKENNLPAAGPEALLHARNGQFTAIVSGSLEKPVLTGSQSQIDQWRGAVALVAAEAVRSPSLVLPSVSENPVTGGAASQKSGRMATAQVGQMLLFLLTMLLAGMVLSNLVEEKANKIIEILAAAIPMDAVFLGKLFAMLGVSVVAIIVWGSVSGAGLLMLGQSLPSVPTPAVGWPAFLGLGVLYFMMAYLLLGSLFLTIGSLAATVREVQTLSMPVTMLQLAVFFFSSYAMSQPGSPVEWAAVLFPLSSPYAMLARAAQEADMMQHLIALAYQALAVGITIRIGASLFRKRVMKSGPQKRRSLFRRWAKKS
ncbi:MAG: ABC transporter permease [Sphingomonadaceae bacterium]